MCTCTDFEGASNKFQFKWFEINWIKLFPLFDEMTLYSLEFHVFQEYALGLHHNAGVFIQSRYSIDQQFKLRRCMSMFCFCSMYGASCFYSFGIDFNNIFHFFFYVNRRSFDAHCFSLKFNVFFTLFPFL